MTIKEAQDLVMEIWDEMPELSDWEIEFLESIGDQLDREEGLSQKQMDKLMQIHKRAMETTHD